MNMNLVIILLALAGLLIICCKTFSSPYIACNAVGTFCSLFTALAMIQHQLSIIEGLIIICVILALAYLIYTPLKTSLFVRNCYIMFNVNFSKSQEIIERENLNITIITKPLNTVILSYREHQAEQAHHLQKALKQEAQGMPLSGFLLLSSSIILYLWQGIS
ncbi:hypothetical protein [Priestia filamentosa]|uniref:Uncharacterized protein n=1 Tax=Priestia filamentosa TaxID=1402861 RepID=A0A1X7E615_9BACI|nr:hypothetical protein [Priestia filamentosa]AKO92481.1 hypothetical protein BEH_10510 [Priestia filamentosa]MDT3762548.1 hypothetical protein [Priestia filamentosa]OXS69097.1 hypothetical protein B1B01_08930 [Priestia filamentosa]RJS64194.1 hypothetical protein CJ485_05395 [Priestia filamentosa]WCM17611.1 hypothetical protein PGN40_09730 [Priestia filamentosa]